MKKRLTRNQIILIVLVAILIATLIAGGVVYARYTQTIRAESITIIVNPDSTNSSVVETPYKSDIPFDRVHPVYPFG